MTILVTGVYGFLGFNLANALVKTHKVFGLYSKSIRPGLSPKIKTFRNLKDLKFQVDLVAVCHGAIASGTTTLPDDVLNSINVDLTHTILRQVPGARVIYVSTVAVYGDASEVVTEITAANPISSYALSKLKAEKLVEEQFNGNIVRFSSIYGVGMKENTLIPNYCNQALNNRVIEVWGSGNRMQNYIHINDAVDLLISIININTKVGFPILGVHTREYTNLEVSRIIAYETGCQIMFKGNDYSKSVNYNNNNTQECLKWRPKTEFTSGLLSFLQWKQKRS
jgi:nucleoside-diphosphate-sugar epimerase